MLQNTSQTYGTVSKFLHWSIGLLIMTLLGVGLYMTDLPDGDQKWSIYGVHKSFGMVVFLLVGIKVVWHFVTVKPQLPATMPMWQVKLSKVVHFALLLFMGLYPLSGLSMSLMGGYAVDIFGLIHIPAFSEKYAFAGVAHKFHVTMPFVVIGLIVLHTVGALYHHFFVKDNILKRMTWG